MANIEEKILKLLELTKSPNQNEAYLAATKAQELMAKYNISVSNLKGANNQKSLEGITNSSGKSYRFRLAKIIADNYGVKHYYINKMVVAFYGHSANVKTACEVYDYLHNVIHRLADSHQTKHYKKYKTTKGVYNSFVAGFLDGLKERLDENCKALAIVVPEDVEKSWEEFSSSFKGIKCKGMAINGLNQDSYDTGFEAGKSCTAHQSIE